MKYLIRIFGTFIYISYLILNSLLLKAQEIDLSEYDRDVQSTLLEMAAQNNPTDNHQFANYSAHVQATLLEMAGNNPAILSLQQNDNSSVVVDFREGRIELISTSQQSLKNVIVQTVLTQIDPNDIDPKTAHDFGLKSRSGKPFFYLQILDQDKQAINSHWRALRYADFLLRQSTITREQQYAVNIYLSSNHIEIESVKYYSLVAAASLRHQVPISLIYGVIETESAFNPKARSSSNAIGLMQILQRQAGLEYFQKVKKRNQVPSESFLFNTSNNVEVGTAYLAILGTHYLHQIKNPTIREYAVIASYNGGAGNLYKSLNASGNRNAAINRLNRMSESEAYWFMTNRHHREETRNYLKRVKKYQQKYKHLDR